MIKRFYKKVSILLVANFIFLNINVVQVIEEICII